jgi:ribulose-phosphate 3-epimerase
MTVNPGFAHQLFLYTIKPGCDLEGDGGIDATTARLAVSAGANVLVAGSAIFGGSEAVPAAMTRLRAAVR